MDVKDDLHSYLQRFERFARSNNWEGDQWSVFLNLLLTGNALDGYSRLSDEAEALRKRYDLTEEGYHKKF